MAYTALATVNTGDSWSAADHNTYIKDNLAYLKTAADTHSMQAQVVGLTTNVGVADDQYRFVIPIHLDGYRLSAVQARVRTAGTTGTTDIMIRNASSSTDMLSTKVTIDSGENSSTTAATPYVIDTANDDVTADQVIEVDVDAVSSTPPKGLIIVLTFTKD